MRKWQNKEKCSAGDSQWITPVFRSKYSHPGWCWILGVTGTSFPPADFASDGPIRDSDEREGQPALSPGRARQCRWEDLSARKRERQEGQMVREALGHGQQHFQSHPCHCGQHEGEAKPRQSHDFSVNWWVGDTRLRGGHCSPHPLPYRIGEDGSGGWVWALGVKE